MVRHQRFDRYPLVVAEPRFVAGQGSQMGFRFLAKYGPIFPAKGGRDIHSDLFRREIGESAAIKIVGKGVNAGNLEEALVRMLVPVAGEADSQEDAARL